jgi:hypothetical protein
MHEVMIPHVFAQSTICQELKNSKNRTEFEI